MRLAGKTALITGSTRGIGRALAEGFAAEGATVLVHGRSDEAAREVADTIGATAMAVDLSEDGAAEELARRVGECFDSLDVLVNNAGLEAIMPIGQIDMATFDLIWRVNARFPVELAEHLLPWLKHAKNGASVINVTSIHQTMPYPHNAAYSMAKASLAMYSQTAAVELAGAGIRVNNFAPGAIETDLNREVVQSMRDQFAEWIPAGRCGSAEEMISPAVFLAGDESSYVTGTTLYADGGYMQNLVRYRP